MRAVGEQRHRVRRQPAPHLCRHQGNVQPGADAKSDAETGGGMVMAVAMVVIMAMIMVVAVVMPMAMLGVIVVVMMRRRHDPPPAAWAMRSHRIAAGAGQPPCGAPRVGQ